MNRMFIIFLLSFALLYPCISNAQDAIHVEDPKPASVESETAQPRAAIERSHSPMDGFTLQMGVFSPLHNEMKGIYGNMFALSGLYCLNMSPSMDILASIGFMRKSGNPYYDSPTFSTGESSTIQIVPMELSIRRRVVFMKSPSGYASRGLYAGVGINYIRGKEEIPGIVSATGGDFGTQIFAGPQMFFTENLAFEGEIKLLMNNLDMKYEDERYSITLSGLVIRAALSWYY